MIVSDNATPEVCEIFTGLTTLEAATTCPITGKRAKAGSAAELIISNFDLPIACERIAR